MRYSCQSPCCCRGNGCYILCSSVWFLLFSKLFNWTSLLQFPLRDSEQILLLVHLILRLNGSFLHFIFPFPVLFFAIVTIKKLNSPSDSSLNSHSAKLPSKRDTEYPAGKDVFFHTPVRLSYYTDWDMPLTLIINVILLHRMVYLLSH